MSKMGAVSLNEGGDEEQQPDTLDSIGIAERGRGVILRARFLSETQPAGNNPVSFKLIFKLLRDTLGFK